MGSKPSLVRYHTRKGVRVALCSTKRKYIHVLFVGALHVTRVPVAEARHIQPIEDYPLRKAQVKFRQDLRLRHAGSLVGLPKAVRTMVGG